MLLCPSRGLCRGPGTKIYVLRVSSHLFLILHTSVHQYAFALGCTEQRATMLVEPYEVGYYLMRDRHFLPFPSGWSRSATLQGSVEIRGGNQFANLTLGT